MNGAPDVWVVFMYGPPAGLFFRRTPRFSARFRLGPPALSEPRKIRFVDYFEETIAYRDILIHMPPRARLKAPPTKDVRLETFDIHGHNGNQPLDYEAFFSFIASLKGTQRKDQVSDRIIAVPRLLREDELFLLSAYAGSSDTSFLVLDLDEGSEEVRHIERGKLLATRTVGVIDPIRRIAVIQYVHLGVRAQQIATLFEKLARANSPQFAGCTLEFAPRPGEEFRRQMQELERIQSVAMTLTRPNDDWTDYAESLTGIAADSNAHNVSLSASASRSQSLSKREGAVRLLRELLGGGATRRSIVKNASVHGQRTGEDGDATLKLNKLSEAKTVRVVLDNGVPDQNAVANAATDFLNNLGENT